MSQDKWQVLDKVTGSVQAEVLKGFLEAQGIEVILSQEGIGESVFPVSIGPLSEIQILVRADQLEEAQKIMSEYNAGDFEDLADSDNESDDMPEG